MGRKAALLLVPVVWLALPGPLRAEDARPAPAPPAAEALDESAPRWRGSIGALERHVRLAIARTTEARRRATIAKPPTARPGRVGVPGQAVTPPDADTASGEGTLPARLWFGPGVPNPSSGEVSFRLDLPAPSSVRLAIVDVAGRVVHEARSIHPAGRHTLRWGGVDRGGQPLRAGVYFARLEVGARPIGTRRVVVLR